ncbi:10546_t:CDS:2 [Dentiscutata heterogama]|uniref:10546_t:CDS:1 n=1 Tax=Dentiscutata heterogama TaxID=1316150 RepID=A0ACA9M3E2_9GLOM|nr:10546_t:CDS:2 [Dentiscutata heterogama]
MAYLLIAPIIFLLMFDLAYFAIGSAINTIMEVIIRIEHTKRNIDNVQTTTTKKLLDREPKDQVEVESGSEEKSKDFHKKRVTNSGT